MELFLDDPNSDVDSNERTIAKRIHLIGFIGSVLPPVNFALVYLYSKTINSNKKFLKEHISNALNFQFLFSLLALLGIGLFFLISLFYVLLYVLFLILFQSINTFNNYSTAKNGTIYQLPLSFNLF